MKATQAVPEGWTIEKESRWQQLAAEVDADEYREYVEGGGLREFDSWREIKLGDNTLDAMSTRHPSTWAEHQHRPDGPVDVWAPPHLPYSPERFTR